MTNNRAGHQPQRSMPSDLSSLLGNVKRQLSFNSRKASGLQDGPTSAGYYGMTAEEDAARVYNLPPPPSLVPPPTFQQIASGVAVRSRRTPGTRRPSTTDSTVSPPPAPPVKRTSSFSRLFSTSQPSLPPPPLPTNIVYPHNAASSSSSTTASTSTSSSSAPAVKHHAKHKLSLSISTITGRAPRGRGIQAIGSGTNSSMSSMDSGVSWGGLDDGHTSAKKAVRFSEDGSDPTVSPGIKTPNHRSPSPAPARRVLPSTALLLPPTTTRQPFPQPTSSTKFVEKTTRLFSRNCMVGDRDRKIYVERSRKWGTKSVWLAEWLSNGAEYCKTPEGKKEFEAWIHDAFGERARAVLQECYTPPDPNERSGGGNIQMFQKAGLDLGWPFRGLILTHQFCSEKRIGDPPRTLPPPTKRKGESSSAWLTRAHEERLKGCKVPPIDWNEMRRIAFSEFDMVRDQMEVWRTRPEMFFDGLLQRATSTILNPGYPKEAQFSQSCMDAMRSRLHIAHMQYAAWSQASSLFEDLDKKGLKTPNQVIEAFQVDPQLLGRIVAVYIYVTQVLRWFLGKLDQVLTSSDYMRPYFKRERINGSAVITLDMDYVLAHHPETGTMEFLVTNLFRDDLGDNSAALPIAKISYLMPALQKSRERAKITAEAYETIGDLAVVSEFVDALENTSFGEALKQAVADADRMGTSKNWFPIMSPIAREQLRIEPANARFDRFVQHEWIVKSVVDTWLGAVFNLEARPFLDKLIETNTYDATFDFFWMNVDLALQMHSIRLERAPGTVKKFFGLIDPTDKNRPIHSTVWLSDLDPRKDREASPKVAEESQDPDDTSAIPSIPIATPQESVARAPARPQQKKKKKTKGQAKPTPERQRQDTGRAEEVLPRSLLPTTKNLSRFNKEIFERILSSEEKSGQIRWGDFEKAMAQLGFEVVQTEGSSVRFDSPIWGARPISFHRPHPDSTMNPSMIKWVGARLRRCYGWTANDFEPPVPSIS